MEEYKIDFRHGKGQRKHEIQRFYDKLKDYALKMLFEWLDNIEICASSFRINLAHCKDGYVVNHTQINRSWCGLVER